jgi:hypothetical protein
MSAGTIFTDKIKALNFSSFNTSTSTGVVFTDNYEHEEVTAQYPGLLFALEIANKRYNADAVYFRSLRESIIPQVYIFDYTTKILTPKEKNELHIKMWNGFQVPVYIIIEKNSVSVFDSREKPKSNQENYAGEILKYTGEALKEFNANIFDNGLFWEEKLSENHFNFEESAARDLIRGLKSVYKDFQQKSDLDKHIALKLLVQSLLIKYLEDRDENEENGYFTKNYFNNHFQCKNFCEVIRAGKLLDLFDKLSVDFNGRIFLWDEKTKEGMSARKAVKKTSVECLANYLDGDREEEQFVLWRLYSFSHLPVELISSVYEELLTDSKDIVYTPEMIVDVMIDECMPLSKPVENFKLIDVSCGSGIFLVKAYNRIIQWWRYIQWKKTGNLVKPSLKVLKNLLETSIYGIDIEEDAVHLAIFSLALAMLDEVNLTPPTWENLKFPDLSNNITQDNFFRYITDQPKNDYDLVIGNPPFNLPPDRNGDRKGKEPKRKEYFAKLEREIAYKTEISIPDQNPALHFLVKSMKLIKQGAQLCLIQPSGPLLYQTNNIRQDLFSQYNLLEVIDFTKLSEVLWRNTKVAAAAVFIQNLPPDKNEVLHIIADRLPQNTKRLFLEFNYYDFYRVDKEHVKHNPYVWKANLLGGSQRLLSLIERLSKLPTLGNFLDDRKKNHGWKYSEGYSLGNKKNYAEYIYNKPVIRPKYFKPSGILKIEIETESHFEAPREESKEIFLPPHILIKETIEGGKVPIEYLDYEAVFSNRIVGIYAPPSEIHLLKNLFNFFVDNNSFLYRFYILVTSSQMLIGKKSAVLKKDIDNLPFPETEKELKISQADQILINDVINFNVQEKNKLSKIVTEKHLLKYVNIFCKILNSVYQTKEKNFQLFKILDAGKYFAIHIVYVGHNIHPKFESVAYLEQYIETVIPINKTRYDNYHIQKTIKIYGKDTIIIAKPKQFRYWLLSIAFRDADESFTDYVEARNLNVKR